MPLCLMVKKSVAERIVYGALDSVERKVKTDPVDLFHRALENVAPHIEVRSRRVGELLIRFRLMFVLIVVRLLRFVG